MKNIIIAGCFVTGLIMMQFAQAQTVDEIINNHIVAIGGKEKMLSLKTVKMTGNVLNPQGGQITVIFTKKHMTGFRIDRGKIDWSIITSKKGWVLGQGATTPKEMQADIINMLQKEFDLQGQFINYKGKGTKIELDGKEKVNGSECYKLKLTYKDGKRAMYYIDTKTHRISRRIFETVGDIIYSNYKQNAGGYWFAYTETGAKSGGQRNFTKIETNIPVDNKIFEVDEGIF